MSRTVGYLWDTLYGWVDTGSGGFTPADPAAGLQPIAHHVAHADTKRRFHEAVQVSPLRDELTTLTPTHASEEDLLRVHTAEHVASIKRQSDNPKGGDAGDGATPFGKGGFDIGRLAAGGAIRAVEAVVGGEVDTAYALINPPGHHAERARGMGYRNQTPGDQARFFGLHPTVTQLAVDLARPFHGDGLTRPRK